MVIVDDLESELDQTSSAGTARALSVEETDAGAQQPQSKCFAVIRLGGLSLDRRLVLLRRPARIVYRARQYSSIGRLNRAVAGDIPALRQEHSDSRTGGRGERSSKGLCFGEGSSSSPARRHRFGDSALVGSKLRKRIRHAANEDTFAAVLRKPATSPFGSNVVIHRHEKLDSRKVGLRTSRHREESRAC